MALEELGKGTFIYRDAAALAADFCDDVVARFEADPERGPGRQGPRAEVVDSIKRSTDLRVSGRAPWQDVDQQLFHSLTRALGELSALHPYFAHNAFKDTGYQLQRYHPGEYYHWHVDGGPGVFSQRQLVATWYLNDVPGPGGETEFAFQSVKVRPTRGALILFPPFWTHVHRAVTLETGSKYIATTWVCFAG